MTKRTSISKPPTPSRDRGKKVPPKRTVALNSGRDAVKRRPAEAVAVAAPRSVPKARAHAKDRTSTAGKAAPSIIATQIQLLETMFRWTPLGMLMRYQELERERSEQSGSHIGKRR